MQFLKLLPKKTVKRFVIVTLLRDEHSENAFESILVTFFGIVIFVNDEHPLKAFTPISTNNAAPRVYV